MKELNDNDKNLINKGLVVIDMFADWCGPCKALMPTVEKLADEYKGKVEFFKCNVDDCSDFVLQFGIRNIPTLIFLKDGELQNRLVGSQLEQTIKECLDLMISENLIVDENNN